MRLPRPFYRLPLQLDVDRLRSEVHALPSDAWAPHPNDIPGNSSLRLISVEGGENDGVEGDMRATPHLRRSPYLRQILASFGVVWSRSRLMRLAPRSRVPEHADINHHWFNRVRLHIPVITQPEVTFHCGDQTVHMAAGEAWLFDNWRVHHVENPTDSERIHFVADTSGSAAFWQLVAQSEAPRGSSRELPFDGKAYEPMTERARQRPVMPPAEIELLVTDLRSEIVATDATRNAEVTRYHALLHGFCSDWRQLYSLHGEDAAGRSRFVTLRDRVRESSRQIGEGLVMRTNGVAAHRVLEARVLRSCLDSPEPVMAAPAAEAAEAHGSAQARPSRAPAEFAAPPSKPVFIVAAPRSGSTLLFETLAASDRVYTLGGEAHWLVETLASLRPGAQGVESNRLEARHATPEVAAHVLSQITAKRRDSHGTRVTDESLKFLEKTPKNALRIPFFDAMFSDARFIFLWRDPRENIASIIEAWASGQWITYERLEGWEGPWSLLLPPGYRELRGRAPADIAAFQWSVANRIALDDLEALPRERWTSICYTDLVRDPGTTITRLASFMQLAERKDEGLAKRLAAALPASRYTHTPPAADKWKYHEAEILRVLPQLEPTWARLRALADATSNGTTLN